MSSNPLARFDVPVEKRAALAALNRVPVISPAVLGLLLASTGGVIATDVLALRGHLALGWACLVNCFLMYWQFTVVHEAIHRSAARGQRLNDLLGRIGLATFAPQVNLGIFRWAHVQHHRFTNSAKDPDRWMHGRWWSLPLRWMFLDVGYFFFVSRHGDATARRHMRGVWRNLALTALAVLALCWLGYGKELLLLWVIPARITFVTVGFVFFYLPHVNHDVASDEDLTQASSVRLGHEWLLTPLFQFHNYHLMHHLFPTMPEYQHLKAWRLLQPELMHRNLQIQHGFALWPVVHRGR